MTDDKVRIPDDAAIIDMYWARDEQAIHFTDLKYRAYLLGVIKHILADLRDREECLSDTYLGAWNTMPPNRPTSLPAYLCTIMRRKAIDVHRKLHAKKSVPTALSVSFDDLAECLSGDLADHTEDEARELGLLINGYMSTLSERARYIFIARYFYARPIEQIASALGCSRPTVNREISMIKNDLRNYLEKGGYRL